MINVVLASDQNYFAGLAGSLLSVAFNTSTTVNIIVIDGGIKDDSWNRLHQYVSKNLKHVSLSRLKLDLSKLNRVKKDNGNGVNAYIRVLVGSLLPQLKKVVYIDSDFYFGKDIAELDKIDFDGKVAIVVQDVGEKYLKNDCPVLESHMLDPMAPYFNSGFMVIDLEKWRQEGIEKATLNLLNNPSLKFRCYDQTALNATLVNKVKLISLEWNDHKYFPVNFEHDSINVNFHLFGPNKPWNGYPINAYYFLFQRILRKIGLGNLSYKKFFYKDYYKLLLASLLNRFSFYPNNHFWTKVLNSRNKVEELFILKFEK